MASADRSGDELLAALEALASDQRLRILATLTEKRNYVSQLAREVGMSRQLLYLHLRRLEAAGLVEGNLELAEEGGTAMKYYEVVPFAIELTPERIAEAASSLSGDDDEGDETEGGTDDV